MASTIKRKINEGITQVKNACLNELQRLQLEDKHKKWLAEAYMYAELPNVEYDEELVKKVWRAVDELPEQTRAVFALGLGATPR